MNFFGFTSLFSFLFICLLNGVKATPTAPGLTYAFSGSFNFTLNSVTFPGPFGDRVSAGYTGGSLKNSAGVVIGSVVAGHGAENGVIDKNGLFHVDGRLLYKFNDGAFAFMNFVGKGIFFSTNYFYLSAETNSTTYAAWNKQFFLGRSTITGTTLTFDCFVPS